MTIRALVLTAAACLATAVLAGLALAGWRIPLPVDAGRVHAVLVIGGFFGTVISLERAVGLGDRRAYAAPVLTAAGALLFLSGSGAGLTLMLVGSLVFVVATARVFRLARGAPFAAVMLAGACALPAGHLVVLAGRPPADAAPFWMAFLVLTIAGERLELSRVLAPPAAVTRVLAAAAALLWAGAFTGLRASQSGQAVAGAGLVALAAVLARADVARLNRGRPGLPGFSAAAILGGYGWLALGGVCGVLDALLFRALMRDAFLHAVFLGFVFSMVVGHAPVILPAVLRRPVTFHPAAWGPLVLLHASVATRVVTDALEHGRGRMAAAALNAAALAAFAAVTAWTVVRSPRT